MKPIAFKNDASTCKKTALVIQVLLAFCGLQVMYEDVTDNAKIGRCQSTKMQQRILSPLHKYTEFAQEQVISMPSDIVRGDQRSTFPLRILIPFQRGSSTSSNDSMP